MLFESALLVRYTRKVGARYGPTGGCLGKGFALLHRPGLRGAI